MENYVQRNPQTDNGLQGMKDVIAPLGPVDVAVHRVIAEGDLVAVHSNDKTFNTAGSTSSVLTTTGRSSSLGCQPADTGYHGER